MTVLLDLTDEVVPTGKVKVPPRAAETDAELISVNGVAITEAAIREEAQHHPADTPAAAFADAARALTVRELLLQEAKARAIEPQPESLDSGKQETDEDAAIRMLLDDQVKTPEAEPGVCARYYESNRGKFVSETLYEARHILLAAAHDETTKRQQAKGEAAAIIETLKQHPEQFSALAKDASACPSAMQGGNLGQLSRGSTVPAFEKALLSLSEGQLCPNPVETQFGFHVIQLDRVHKGKSLPFEMVEDRIAAWLEAASWSRAVSQYIGILAGAAEINGIDVSGTGSPLVQ